MLAKAITNAAHPTGNLPNLRNHQFERKKRGVYWLTMKVDYYGALTGKEYSATIIVTVNTNEGAWAVTAIQFDDLSNIIPANKQNLADLRLKLTEILVR